ncbi:PAS domain-containing protein [Methanogenium organophilum]|uniref:PAS domain S-box protein n=1 Tax=Methanogenium organophilum TaxID=2199 RepID=A0A9X9T8M1_METOG|nr:PAS domain S-box protein [Methanogenium organophilum]WAI02618.1 PAS domain S-box protein [Methanogenium organophilum]
MASGNKRYEEDLKEIRNRIIGFGESSIKKSYYPQLQYKQEELERFRVTLDSTRDIVFILEPLTGHIIDANSQAEKMLGYTSKELLNMTIFDLADHGRLHKIFAMVGSEPGSSEIIQTPVVVRDGQVIRMELSISSAHFEKDNYITVLCRDITEREEMEAAIRYSEFQYRTTINTLHDILVVIDESFRIIIYNDAFETLCRNSGVRGDIQGMNLKAMGSFFSYEKDSGFLNSFVLQDYFEEEIKYRYNGKFAIYSLRNMPMVENGVFKQSVLYMRDTTEYFVLENMKKEAFIQIDKNMEQFAVLNDHIRNPLQVILSIIDLECSDEVTEKILPYIKEIDNLINNLDNGWIESEKVRNMIVRHYGISLIDRSDISDIIRYLQDKCES